MARRTARRTRVAAVASSKAKAFASFTDQFSSSLRSGWKTVRSGWGYENNKVASASPSTYPLISAPIKNSDVTISLKNPGIGTGAALWVTDSGNWWAIITEQQESVGTGDCNQYNPVNNCGAGGNCGTVDNRYAYQADFGNQCINTQTTGYPANADSYGNYSCSCQNANNCQSGTVSAGWTSYWSNCANLAYNAYTCGWVTVPHQYYDNCKTGGNCKGWGNCLVYGNYFVTCCKNGYNACVGGYIWWTTEESAAPCCSGGYVWYETFTNSNCATGSPATSYCGGCGFIPGSPAYSITNNCSCCGRTPQDLRWVTGGYIDYCGFRYSCVATGGECTGHYNTYPRYIRIYKYVSNILTEVASQTLDAVTSFTPIRGLKVTVSNSIKGGSSATITTKVYSDTNMTTQIGSDFIHQATGLKITTNYGIIAKPSSYNQDISVEQVSIG